MARPSAHKTRPKDAEMVEPDTALRLSARDLTVGYGDKTIVKNVSLDIKPAAITTLIGPNGCGKSTKSVARKIALLPQGPVAPQGLTVTELVCQGRFPHQSLLRQWTAKDKQAVERALAQTDLLDFADRPVHDLSGGQRQRCWLAMALAQDTPILLLDEPTTFLDLKVQVDLMALLSKIVKEDGKTILMVLHELNLAAAFADHIVMMKNGQIIAQGRSEEVINPTQLNSVFGLCADVVPDPLTGRPFCLPRPLDAVHNA